MWGRVLAAVEADSIVKLINDVLGPFPLVGPLLLMIVVDVVLGCGAAFIAKQVSSTVSFTGMLRKVGILLIVAFASILEAVLTQIDPEVKLPVAKLSAVYFIWTEAISIVENAKRAGIPIPDVVTDALAKLHNGQKPSLVKSNPHLKVEHAETVNVTTTTGPAGPAGPVGPAGVAGPRGDSVVIRGKDGSIHSDG